MLNRAKVVFCTLSVAGRSMMKNIDDIDVLIVDEAGQSVEAETLIAFSLNPKKCLLVGDVNQLPATVISPEAEKNNFACSMMWRLIVERRQTYQMLTVQYRMHPHIRQWPSDQYYAGRLEDGEHIATRQLPYKPQNNFLFSAYAFVNVSSGREQKSGHSFINRNEAFAIIDALRYLKNQCHIGIQQHVGIVTFYAAQADLLKRLIKEKNLGNVRVHTVDGFQGDENDIIMILFVRANQYAGVGFLKDFRRLNVAITRPKHTLLIFGYLPTLELAHNADVSKLIEDVKQRNLVYSEQEFNHIVKPLAPVASSTSAPAPHKQAQHQKQRQPKYPPSRYFHQGTNAHQESTSSTTPKKSHPKKPFNKSNFFKNHQSDNYRRRDDDHGHPSNGPNFKNG